MVFILRSKKANYPPIVIDDKESVARLGALSAKEREIIEKFLKIIGFEINKI
jgi:hypothetical protein